MTPQGAGHGQAAGPGTGGPLNDGLQQVVGLPGLDVGDEGAQGLDGVGEGRSS